MVVVNRPRFVRRVPEWFPTRKAAQVVAFFCLKAGGTINVLRLTKLVYLADRKSIERRDHHITDDDFVSMPFGPVNTITYSYINGEVDSRQEEWGAFVGERTNHDVPVTAGVTPDALDELSRADLTVLEDTWDEFKDIEKYELADWTHKYCPEWRDPSGSSVPISFATVFGKLKKAAAVELSEQIEAERSLSAMLASR